VGSIRDGAVALLARSPFLAIRAAMAGSGRREGLVQGRHRLKSSIAASQALVAHS